MRPQKWPSYWFSWMNTPQWCSGSIHIIIGTAYPNYYTFFEISFLPRDGGRDYLSFSAFLASSILRV